MEDGKIAVDGGEPRQGVHVDDPADAVAAEAKVDPRQVPQLKGRKGREGALLQGVPEGREDGFRPLVADPLYVISFFLDGVEEFLRRGAGGDAHHPGDFRFFPSDHTHGDLISGKIFLGEGRLAVSGPEAPYLFFHFTAVVGHRVGKNPLGGSLKPGLYNEAVSLSEKGRNLGKIAFSPEGGRKGNGYPLPREGAGGEKLVKGKGQSDRVGPPEGDIEALEYARDLGFPSPGAAPPFGEVDHKGGSLFSESVEEIIVLFTERDMEAEGGDCVRDGLDRGDGVILFVLVVRFGRGRGLFQVVDH